MATTRPTLDGEISEAEWSGALTIDNLSQIRPREGQPPTYATRFRLLRDADHLYVAIDAQDTEPARISAHQLIQGQTFPGDDRVWIMLDPTGGRQQGYLFQVNANGIRRDALLDNLDTFNDDWDGIWEADARIGAQGWQVELVIPWRTLPFDPGAATFGINFGRMLVREGEYLLWSSSGGLDKPAYWGAARMPPDMNTGHGWDVIPSIVLRTNPDGEAESRITPALDARYRIGSQWQGTLTLNTDFSGTSLDDRQVNLTRFPLFLPEKRYFFVQDADVFAFAHLGVHGNPFFSRRVALAPDGSPLDMQGGAKIVGRGTGYSLGALVVSQDLPDQGDARLGVVRGKWAPSDTFSLGGIGTWGNPDTGDKDALMGTDARLHVPALFGRFVTNLTGFFMHSSPEQTASDNAYGAALNLESPNASLLAAWGRYGDDFVLPLGFQSFGGGQDWTVEQTATINLNTARLRSYGISSSAYRLENTDGRLVTATTRLSPTVLTTASGDLWTTTLSRHEDQLDEPFVYLGQHVIAPGAYRYDRSAVAYESASYRNFALILGYEWGDFFDGTRNDTRIGLDWKPGRHFALSTGYVRNRAVFETRDLTADTYRIRFDIAPNREWSLSSVSQYDTVTKLLASLVRLRYLPRSGQLFELSYRHERLRSDAMPTRSDSGAALKASYTFQF